MDEKKKKLCVKEKSRGKFLNQADGWKKKYESWAISFDD